MHSENPKVKSILAIGQPKDDEKKWPDYIEYYGFTPEDTSALLAVYGDVEINSLDTSRPEAWAPVHAWRILGQLRSEQAIGPVIASFDTMFDDDYALSELGKVLGLIGAKAIDPLSHYLRQPGKDEFSYVMAVDALGEIAEIHPECRAQVLEIYQQYMATPLETARALNGLLVCQLLDLDATETIDDIRRLYSEGCVDITCAGDLEEVEIALGFRVERSTPKPNFAEQERHERSLLYVQDDDDSYDIIEYWLMEHGSDESILSASELDGYFAAIVCAPETISPSTWMPAIWGGQELAPKWHRKEDVEQFTQEIFKLYNNVIDCLRERDFAPIFLETAIDPDAPLVVDDWCEGFMRGAVLWGAMPPEAMQHLEKCLYPIRYFSTEEGDQQLETMTDTEIISLQRSIAPAVEKLYLHFCMPTASANATFVHATPKVGRNEPCPCGSGKKYKKCCGLN